MKHAVQIMLEYDGLSLTMHHTRLLKICSYDVYRLQAENLTGSSPLATDSEPEAYRSVQTTHWEYREKEQVTGVVLVPKQCVCIQGWSTAVLLQGDGVLGRRPSMTSPPPLQQKQSRSRQGYSRRHPSSSSPRLYRVHLHQAHFPQLLPHGEQPALWQLVRYVPQTASIANRFGCAAFASTDSRVPANNMSLVSAKARI